MLLPGFTGSKEDFLPILEPLAGAGRTVFAADLRGQYQSPAASDPRGYQADELAADVLALAAVVVPPPGGVHLLGHSLGGLIARQAALAGPEAVLSLTLLSSGPGAIGGLRARLLREMLKLLDADHDGVPTDRRRLRMAIRQMWQERLEPEARADGTDEHIIAFLRERTLRTCPVGLIELARYLLDCPDRTADLAALTDLPIQVIYGENDDAWPPTVQDDMARRLGAERVCIPGAAHSPAIEAPETTAATLTSFWNAAERQRSTGPARSARTARAAGAPADTAAQHR
jgi:pimeloyl-ACP methyl ester carboxylesterase